MWFAAQGWVTADNDTFKMWYWGLNPTVGENALNSIGYAWSVDGSNWTRVTGPGALGSVYDPDMADLPDSSGVAMPCVVKDGDTYHMWHAQIQVRSRFCILASVFCSPKTGQDLELHGPYLCQNPPGSTPEIYAHGIVSKEELL